MFQTHLKLINAHLDLSESEDEIRKVVSAKDRAWMNMEADVSVDEYFKSFSNI